MNAGDPLWWWGVLIGGLAVGWSLDSWSLRRVKRERDLAIIEAARYKATLADLGLEGADGLVPTYRTVSVEYSSRVDRRILPVVAALLCLAGAALAETRYAPPQSSLPARCSSLSRFVTSEPAYEQRRACTAAGGGSLADDPGSLAMAPMA